MGIKDICISDLSCHDYWRKTAFEPCLMFGRWFIAGTVTRSVRGSLRKRETQITSYRVFLLSSAAVENTVKLLAAAQLKTISCSQALEEISANKENQSGLLKPHLTLKSYCIITKWLIVTITNEFDNIN